ncbi:acyl-CoA dehydrogenase family protein [Nevskia soli]|jgi:alkylation response protein AidB-like acyl-CoA dehydrogenase|uniref:acyl-CoA dehydrogenase family protein n=1 Tax=Nevskia soli TaxID=418856 RepID=UPI0015D7F05B|nr:acyl-CoA dehydrogenase family protein [Nevskia soli]
MDFEYTPEQLQLRREVRDFATTEIAPHVLEWDEAQTFPMEVVKKLGKLGYLGAIFPEEYGGAGLGYVEYAIIIEELSRVDGSVGIIVAAHTSLCSNHIYKAGSEEQKQRYLPRLTTGEWIGCWSLTEPEAGSDAAGTRTTAVRSGEDWVVNGSKTFTTNAHYADVCVGMAVTDRAASQHGISAFLFEKDTPGFRVGKKENKLGLRASATGEVIFTNCRLPATQMLGQLNEGFIDSLRILDGGRVSIAALSIGMAQGAYDAALKYSKQRKQFNRPISEFQAIQHKLVDMATEIDASRLLTYRAATMLDAGKRVTRESAMAKLFASEAAVSIANEAVQIHGGYGFIKDYPVEKFYRDVKLCTIGEGTSEIQRLVIARQLLKD